MTTPSPAPGSDTRPFTTLGKMLEAHRAAGPDTELVEMVAAVAQMYEQGDVPSKQARAAAVDRLSQLPKPVTADAVAAELGLDAVELRRIAGITLPE